MNQLANQFLQEAILFFSSYNVSNSSMIADDFDLPFNGFRNKIAVLPALDPSAPCGRLAIRIPYDNTCQNADMSSPCRQKWPGSSCSSLTFRRAYNRKYNQRRSWVPALAIVAENRTGDFVSISFTSTDFLRKKAPVTKVYFRFWGFINFCFFFFLFSAEQGCP